MVPSATAAPAGSTSEFVRIVRAQVPEVATDRSDAEIRALARRICADLARGTDGETLVGEVRSLGTLDAEAIADATARELIKLAIDTDCGDQAGRVDEF